MMVLPSRDSCLSFGKVLRMTNVTRDKVLRVLYHSGYSDEYSKVIDTTQQESSNNIYHSGYSDQYSGVVRQSDSSSGRSSLWLNRRCGGHLLFCQILGGCCEGYYTGIPQGMD